MKVVFLGTGTSTGVPLIACNCLVCQSKDSKDKRLRSSVYVETEDAKIVVDTGPDFRAQMLSNKIKDIDAVVFTHNHKDHTAGLDDIRPINFLLQKKIDVYAEEYVQKTLKMEYPYIFAEQFYPGLPQIDLHTISHKDTFKVHQTNVIPIRVMHNKLPVLGFRIQDFSYVTDANFIADEEIEKMKGSKVFVINAVRMTAHFSHFSLHEAIEVVKKVNPEKAYITHIGHTMGLYEEVQKTLPENIFLAYDGLTIEV